MISQVDISVKNKDQLLEMYKDIVDRKWFSEGKYCEEYRERLRQFLGRDHVFLAPNGTLGLFLALLALKSEQNYFGEVLVPAFTFYGSATSVIYAGFKPVFVDCNVETFQSDLKHFQEKYTDKTVGIMPIHIYGHMADIQGISNWAKEKGLFVLEDSAQVLGCRRDGHTPGEFSDIAVYSTFSDKIMTTGEGSIVVTDNDEIAKKIKLIRNQGRPNAGTFLHPSLGMNFRLTEFQAALGLHQLISISTEIGERLLRYEKYFELLKDNKNISFMSIDKSSELVPFRFPILSDRRGLLMKKLEDSGIQTRGFFVPMHLQPELKKYASGSLPAAEELSKKGLCLPIHCSIGDDEIKKIAGIINEI